MFIEEIMDKKAHSEKHKMIAKASTEKVQKITIRIITRKIMDKKDKNHLLLKEKKAREAVVAAIVTLEQISVEVIV